MADRLAAEIRIGGKVRRSVAKALCRVVATTGAALEWGEARFHPETIADLLAARCDSGDGLRLLQLFDDQAAWGQFEELEEFLRKQGIAYCRYSEGKYEYDAETSAFHPTRGLLEWLTDQDRHAMVRASELTPITDTLAKLLAEMRGGEMPSAKLRRKIRRIRGKLQKCLPPGVPGLESFEIIGC